MDNVWFTAALWMGLALAASLISIRLGVSVALAKILVGVIGGNSLGAYTTFSTYTYETALLLREAAYLPSLVYLFGSVAAGLAGVLLGIVVAERL